MNDPTLEDVALGWARWAAEGLVDDLVEQGLIEEENQDDASEIVTQHLNDIAVSNATSKAKPAAPMPGPASDAYGLPNDLHAAKEEINEWRSAIEALGVMGGPDALRKRAVEVLSHHDVHHARENAIRRLLDSGRRDVRGSIREILDAEKVEPNSAAPSSGADPGETADLETVSKVYRNGVRDGRRAAIEECAMVAEHYGDEHMSDRCAAAGIIRRRIRQLADQFARVEQEKKT